MVYAQKINHPKLIGFMGLDVRKFSCVKISTFTVDGIDWGVVLMSQVEFKKQQCLMLLTRHVSRHM